MPSPRFYQLTLTITCQVTCTAVLTRCCCYFLCGLDPGFLTFPRWGCRSSYGDLAFGVGVGSRRGNNVASNMLYLLHLMHRGPAPAPLAGLRSAALFSYLCTRSESLSRARHPRQAQNWGHFPQGPRPPILTLFHLSRGTAYAVALDNATSWMSLPETYIPYNFPMRKAGS